MGNARRMRLFRIGRNQAIRIPVEFELPGTEAIMRRQGGKLILEPCGQEKKDLFEWLATLEPWEEDFPDVDEKQGRA